LGAGAGLGFAVVVVPVMVTRSKCRGGNSSEGQNEQGGGK
jgi:hypothetical protein